MHEKIFSILVEEDEVTWKSIIQNLIKTEEMNPWDINLGMLSRKYLDTLKQLKEMDFRLSGKVLLCAAMLLRIKSSRLVSDDIMALDRLIAEPEGMSGEEFYDELENQQNVPSGQPIQPGLIPRLPQPRKRKVSVYDLVNALEKALEVKRRRVLSSIPGLKAEMPLRGANINLVIKQLYARILGFFSIGNKRMSFSQLVPSDSKKDKIAAFIPLLHLTNQKKIDLQQETHFGEINVLLRRYKKEVEEQLPTPVQSAQSSQ